MKSHWPRFGKDKNDLERSVHFQASFKLILNLCHTNWLFTQWQRKRIPLRKRIPRLKKHSKHWGPIVTLFCLYSLSGGIVVDEIIVSCRQYLRCYNLAHLSFTYKAHLNESSFSLLSVLHRAGQLNFHHAGLFQVDIPQVCTWRFSGYLNNHWW